jgi:hypothetical protein
LSVYSNSERTHHLLIGLSWHIDRNMSMTQVPQEIWDAVIDIFALENTSSQLWYQVWRQDSTTRKQPGSALAACSLVSRSWLSRSSQHLFKKIIVFDYKLFLQFAQESLRIALNIKILIFTAATPSTYQHLDSKSAEAIFSILPNLECLSVDSIRYTPQARVSGMWQPNIKLKKLRLATLPETSACWWLCLFYQVQDVLLQDIFQDRLQLANNNFRCVYIEGLRMISCSDEFMIILLKSVLIPHSLQYLGIKKMSTVLTVSGLHEMLRPFGQSVEHLTLDITNSSLPERTCMIVFPFLLTHHN